MIPMRALLLVLVLLSGVLGACFNEPEAPPPAVVDTITVLPGEYLNNRFFLLDQADGADFPGRNPDRELIDPNSIHVFLRIPEGELLPNDVADMAVYLDSSGVWNLSDFQNPMYRNFRWRELNFSLLLNEDGLPGNIDLGHQYTRDDVLGVCYDVTTLGGSIIYKVGDQPGRDEDSREILPDGKPYYRLKLIKPAWPDQTAYTFDYVRRNVYDLGRTGIDIDKFDLVIRRNAVDSDSPTDEGLLPYIRVFGLDKWNTDGRTIPDNLPDLMNPRLFDFVYGLLFFPRDFATPFNGPAIQYETNANSVDFFWDGTYLRHNLTPEVYDYRTNPDDYPQYAPFRIDLKYTR